MSLDELTRDKQVIAIVCNQFGDTGKGKFSDYLAKNFADVIVRGTGGNNAGHTVVIQGKETVFHLLPTGIEYDSLGKVNILGHGMVLNLKVLGNELKELHTRGGSSDNLIISNEAHVIMPYHIKRDLDKNESLKDGGIGSTGRGIGPCYADMIARSSAIRIKDLDDKDKLSKKINDILNLYPEYIGNVEEIIDETLTNFKEVKNFSNIGSTKKLMQEFYEKGKKITIEGAQGFLLSIYHGPYPYVTSSDSSIFGTSFGAGLYPGQVDLTLGMVKFPFMTRVGGGPFPTEIGGFTSEKYCSEGLEHNMEYELRNYEIPFTNTDSGIKYDHNHPKIVELMNSHIRLRQSIGIRLAAGEYGATTGRPRRIGWTDLVLLKNAVLTNGPDIILTKVDSIRGLKEFCLNDVYNSSEESWTESFAGDAEDLREMKPLYTPFEGFEKDISSVKKYDDFPAGLKKGIDLLEEFTGANVRIISTGPEQNQMVFR